MDRKDRINNFNLFASFEDAFAYADSLEGMAPRFGSKETRLLPHLDKVFQMFRVEASLPSLLSQELPAGKDATVSRATLYKFPQYLEGKEKLSRKKVIAIRKRLSLFFAAKNPNQSFAVPFEFNGGVAFSWIPILLVFDHAGIVAPEYQFVLRFIKRRIDAETEVLNNLQLTYQSEASRKDQYAETLLCHIKVPAELTDIFRQCIQLGPHAVPREAQLRLEFCLLLDFIYSLSACLELGWYEKLNANQEFIETFLPKDRQGSVITHLVKLDLQSEGKINTPFDRFLTWLANDVKSGCFERGISQRTLSKFIPVDNPEDTINGYHEEEKQRDLLKDWNSSTYPSNEKFAKFLTNFLGHHGVIFEYLFTLGLVCIALDKLFIQLLMDENAQRDELYYQCLAEGVSQYSAYVEAFRKQHKTEA